VWKHQHHPNRDILITEAWAGRFFEINENGKIVWSRIAQRTENDMVSEMLDEIRYGIEYASFANRLRKDEK
jgi:hypothetical protein